MLADPAQLVGGGFEVAAGGEELGGQGGDLAVRAPEEGGGEAGHGWFI